MAALLPAASLRAQEPTAGADLPRTEPWVLNESGGARVGWDGTGALEGVEPASSLAVAAALSGFPVQRYQGYDLPLRLVTLEAAPGTLLTLEMRGVRALDLPAGSLAPGAPLLPPVIVEEGQPEPVSKETIALPVAPAFLLRSGEVDGRLLVVVALSPYYLENGQLKLAVAVDAYVPGARPLAGSPQQFALKPEPDPIFAAALNGESLPGMESGAVAAAAASVSAALVSWPAYEGTTMDPAALDLNATTVRVVVSKPGIQNLTRAALAAANAAYNSAPLNTLKVTRKGIEVPIQVVGANDVRFYAPAPLGDRWNASDIYLVEVNAADPSPLMSARAVSTAGLPAATSTVFEPGLWVKNDGALGYQSEHAGADGDHYFAGQIRYATDAIGPKSVVANMTDASTGLQSGNTLDAADAAAGNSTYTLVLATRLETPTSPHSYALSVNGVQVNVPSLPEDGSGHLLESVSVSFSLSGRPTTLTISHRSVATPSGTLLDSISMLRPALLKFGGEGATFQAQTNAKSFRWEGLPAGFSLYDVTAAAPVVLSGANGTGFTDSLATRRYLVAGPGTLHTPVVQKRTAFAFTGIKAANAIYIVPGAEYVAPLQPLMALRNQQGVTTAIVNALGLYDTYSYGWVDPYAIRRFLQQAYSTQAWRTVMLSAVLVGDGTVDPKNFENRARNLQLIPPFMAHDADPWLIEAACDSCYGQLNDPPPALGLGENPHLGDDPTNGRWFATELWIGRFPVNSVDELTMLVGKLVAYETSKFNANDPIPGWRGRILYATDNVWRPVNENVAGSQIVLDPAGNHEQISNNIRALNPVAAGKSGNFLAPRVHYALYPDVNAYPIHTQVGPWRIQNANTLGTKLLEELNKGASIFVYNGHANHFFMGDTELGSNVPEGTRPAVVDFNDPNKLSNRNQPFVMIAMTCVAVQFAKPTSSGTVIGERFLLDSDGSAIAVWGPAGQSEANGHVKLQEGFFELLFSRPNVAPRLGELLDAGYMEVMTEAPGSYDVLRTFVLLGDPQTRLSYAQLSNELLLPLVKK